MKRKIFTFTAAAALAAVLTIPAAAAENNVCGQLPWDCPTIDIFCQLPCCPDQAPPCTDIPDMEEIPTPPTDNETPDAEQTPTPPTEDETPDTDVTPTPPPENETPDTEQTPTPPTEDETPDNSVMSQLEQAACELVNARRAENGLEPLTISADLSVKARIKSRDMKENNYFDHNSPTYGSPFALMQSLGITYRSAAENIAMGYRSAEAVVNAWMNSPGHRANILSANYTTMGIGFVDGYWTQWFIG